MQNRTDYNSNRATVRLKRVKSVATARLCRPSNPKPQNTKPPTTRVEQTCFFSNNFCTSTTRFALLCKNVKRLWSFCCAFIGVRRRRRTRGSSLSPRTCRRRAVLLLSAISTVRIFVWYTYVYISWATSIRARASNTTRKEATHTKKKHQTRKAARTQRNVTYKECRCLTQPVPLFSWTRNPLRQRQKKGLRRLRLRSWRRRRRPQIGIEGER